MYQAFTLAGAILYIYGSLPSPGGHILSNKRALKPFSSLCVS